MQVIRELYRQRYDELYRFFLVRTGDVERAEELVQETFSQACASLWRYRSDASLRTWLYAIARNVLNQSRRRRARRPVPVAPEAVESLASCGRPAVLPFPSPEEQLLRDVTWQQVLDALAELPEHYQTAIWLRDAEELPYPELAQVLDRSQGATRVLIHRARRALQQRYRERTAGRDAHAGAGPA